MSYQGKEVLKIPSNFNILGDNLMETPPFQIMQTIPKLSYLIANFESYNWLSVLTQMPFHFLSSVHAINRVFNSEKYDNLETMGMNNIGSLSQIQDNVIKAYNNTLDIDYLKKVLTESDINNAPINGGNPYEEMQSWQTSAVDGIYGKLKQVGDLYEKIKEELKIAKAQELAQNIIDGLSSQLSSLSWKKWSLKNTIEKVENLLGIGGEKGKGLRDEELERVRELILNPNRIRPKTIINSRDYLRPKQLTTLPTNPAGVLGILTEMSNFFLNFFGIPASANILPALTHLVTSIALKTVGVSVTGINYLIGHILRQNVALLPVIVQNTGMWAMAWGMLAPFAPWIILAGVMIAVGLRKQSKLGEILYLFGKQNNQQYPDMNYIILSDSSNQEIYDTLTNQAETMKTNTGKSYSGDSDYLLGFSTYKSKPQYGLNLKNPDDIKNLTRVELELLPTYINQVNSVF